MRRILPIRKTRQKKEKACWKETSILQYVSGTGRNHLEDASKRRFFSSSLNDE